jgi:hypothetical protein
VGDRLDITGARWGLDSAEAVLKLRAVQANDDLDAYLAYHHTREHQRTYPNSATTNSELDQRPSPERIRTRRRLPALRASVSERPCIAKPALDVSIRR